ncbi:EF-hand calcium-binding domain-containing protein 6 [Patella vulgata]|uniref:EF-hand calcium-binding domain-containing protein 6 n=1 Tax=Patella vulgata TaxID=6465 RepID=UPI002180349A|nr:EF-hand calcium-binding domain-containing protein 6 [Patella vulgata]
MSQAGRPFSQTSQGGRPLACEPQPKARKSFSAAGMRESRLSFRKDNFATAPPIDSIPEGVEISHGDPNKPRMPIFGSRAGLGDREEVVPPSRSGTRMSASSTQARLEIDELETLLKDKVRNNYREVKKRFKDNDPEGKGNVSREAFSRILHTLLNRPLGQSQNTRLLERLGLKDKAIISFTEFFSVFRDDEDRNYPKWMDPINRNDRVNMTASQVHTQLKERARQRFTELGDMIPQINSGGSGRILKPEFRQQLNKMTFNLNDEEFDKLWNKYDRDNEGVIKGDKFLKYLGVPTRYITEDGGHGRLSPVGENDSSGSEKGGQRTPKKREVERKQQLDIERWLKDKFREGFFDMKEAFEKKDTENNGVVSFDDFLIVLEQYGLKLDKSLLGAFLSRCSVRTQGRGIPYRDFLHRFQDRSEDGMVHNILTQTKHRYNRSDSPAGNSTLSAIEGQLMNMFQRDFLALLATFKNIDKLGMDRISLEAFRAAVESRFNLELRDDQFESFVDHLPLDEDGDVIYGEFMKQFDTKGKAQSLFNGKKRPDIPVPVRTGSPALPGEAEFEEVAPRRRKTQELFKLIKDLLNRRYQDVEREFYNIDETNTRRITQETMYYLLKRFDISPEVSRGEIRDLWKTFITNSDMTLEFLQFVRHFGYSMRSAAYPNAKIRPPRHGDSDCMIRSRKLNSTRDLLEDHVRAKIEYLFEELSKEFQSMDVYNTGYISVEEFRDVLAELCVQLSDPELNRIVDKFNVRHDGRVSYIDFLKPYAWKQQTWRHGNDMIGILNQPIDDGDTNEGQQVLYGITDKLRQKMSGDWKTLRRAFRKLDLKGDGYLSLPEFRSVLKLANVMLDEDEVYHVMSEFDKGMSGKISYDQFIQETLRPNTRLSVKTSAQ